MNENAVARSFTGTASKYHIYLISPGLVWLLVASEIWFKMKYCWLDFTAEVVATNDFKQGFER